MEFVLISKRLSNKWLGSLFWYVKQLNVRKSALNLLLYFKTSAGETPTSPCGDYSGIMTTSRMLPEAVRRWSICCTVSAVIARTAGA